MADDPIADGTLVSINPADGTSPGAVPVTTPAMLDAMAQAADAARRRSSWHLMRPDRRADILHRISAGLQQQKEPLAQLQMRDNGKPITECRGMVDAAAGCFRYYASVCETLETEVTSPRGEHVSITVLEPYGVVAAITPWNSPIQNEAQKAAPALAAGNAVLLKPSEDSPLLAPELARIALEAGLPEGLLQVVQGQGAEIGPPLVDHPLVRMVSFTGGTATGRDIGQRCGKRLVPTALELGGKSPHIVFADADLDHAIAAVASGIFGSGGQSCVAGSRLLVQRDVYDTVVQGVVERARRIRIGAPDESGVEMGPMASFRHRDRVARYVDLARSEGGRILCGGSVPGDARLARGAYYEPTVIEGLDHTARTVREEIFGPVLVAIPFDDEQELTVLANDSDFGLACGIWTRDFKRAWRVARRIDAGSVWINTYKQSIITTPFGGMKDSGIAREKGPQGLRLYAETKSIYFGLHENPLPLSK